MKRLNVVEWRQQALGISQSQEKTKLKAKMSKNVFNASKGAQNTNKDKSLETCDAVNTT